MLNFSSQWTPSHLKESGSAMLMGKSPFLLRACSYGDAILWGRYRGLTGSYSDKEFMKNKSRPTVIWMAVQYLRHFPWLPS